MSKEKIFRAIAKEKLILNVRAKSMQVAEKLALAGIEAGIKILEIPLTVPHGFSLIAKLKKKKGILVGAGSVFTNEEVLKSIKASADFIVSPVSDGKLIKFCKAKKILVMAGGLTPTEIYRTKQAGADVVKIFPSHLIDAEYIREILGPMPSLKFAFTGGVDLKNLKMLLSVKPVAVGVHANIFKKGNLQTQLRKLRKMVQG